MLLSLVYQLICSSPSSHLYSLHRSKPVANTFAGAQSRSTVTCVFALDLRLRPLAYKSMFMLTAHFMVWLVSSPSRSHSTLHSQLVHPCARLRELFTSALIHEEELGEKSYRFCADHPEPQRRVSGAHKCESFQRKPRTRRASSIRCRCQRDVDQLLAYLNNSVDHEHEFDRTQSTVERKGCETTNRKEIPHNMYTRNTCTGTFLRHIISHPVLLFCVEFWELR